MEQQTPPLTLKSNLWASIEKLMLAQWGKPNVSRLAREAGLGHGTAIRLQHDDGVTSIGLDKVERIARVFGVDPWKLLDPAFDPDDQVQSISAQGRELALTLDRISDPVAKAKFYAMCVQFLEFSNLPLQQTQSTGGAPK